MYYDKGWQTIAFTSAATDFTERATFDYRRIIVRAGFHVAPLATLELILRVSSPGLIARGLIVRGHPS